MTTEPDPFWTTDLGKRTALRKEIADIVNGPNTQAIEDKPAGHFAPGGDATDAEVAEYLGQLGIHTNHHSPRNYH